MKYAGILVALPVSFLALAGSVDALKFEDVVDQFLQPVGQQTGGASSSRHYVFAPGDRVVQKGSYAVYYSGFELSGGQVVLLMTLVENGAAVMLKFPAPDMIRIRDVRLRVHHVGNERLEVEQLAQPSTPVTSSSSSSKSSSYSFTL